MFVGFVRALDIDLVPNSAVLLRRGQENLAFVINKSEVSILFFVFVSNISLPSNSIFLRLCLRLFSSLLGLREFLFVLAEYCIS